MFKRLAVTLCILCILFAGSGAGVAQSTASADTPSKQEVLKFLDVMQVKARVNQMMGSVAKQARLSAEQAFKEKIPDATPAQLAKIDAVADAIFKELPMDEMMDAMVPIYQKHLAKSDLDAVMAFYTSPVGQKLLNEQPAMMAEAMQAGTEIARDRVSALSQDLDKQVGQIIQEEQQKRHPKDKPAPPKK
jgi:hypothetical protein